MSESHVTPLTTSQEAENRPLFIINKILSSSEPHESLVSLIHTLLAYDSADSILEELLENEI